MLLLIFDHESIVDFVDAAVVIDHLVVVTVVGHKENVDDVNFFENAYKKIKPFEEEKKSMEEEKRCFLVHCFNNYFLLL